MIELFLLVHILLLIVCFFALLTGRQYLAIVCYCLFMGSGIGVISYGAIDNLQDRATAEANIELMGEINSICENEGMKIYKYRINDCGNDFSSMICYGGLTNQGETKFQTYYKRDGKLTKA